MININSILYESNENNNNNIIFREFNKIKDKYIATNKFYISFKTNSNNYEFKEVDINLQPIKNFTKIIYNNNNNLYYIVNNSLININNNDYIDLVLIKNISFTINDINIEKNDLLKRFIENDLNIDEKIIEDLYYNKDFSKKIKLNIPKNHYSFENKNFSKKYLFKINSIELNQSFYQEDKNLLYV
jgi:hypothetical protein